MDFNRVAQRNTSAMVSVTIACAVAVTGCGGSGNGGGGGASAGSSFSDQPLVVNKQEVTNVTATVDGNLQNPWGIAMGPGLPIWVADNNSNVVTLYSGAGAVENQQATGSATAGVAVPPSAGGVAANPTGAVYNGTGQFLIATASGQETAQFIYDGEGGTIAAWAKDSGASAVVVYDDGVSNGADHAVYKGLALGSVAGANYLYATDLKHAKVDVFDKDFAMPAAMQGKFVDAGLPAGYAPFGIASINGQLIVTYAMQDTAKHDEQTGAGLGYVDVFDFSGNLVNRFASAGSLNAPWAIALAPAGFTSAAGDILIGNFGDGTINVFSPQGTSSATSKGSLANSSGQPLTLPGLWSLLPGNGDADKPVTKLFYSTGFASQTDGAIGSISVSAAPAPNPY
jgi:uncharacterized protein (TIGR03118 family)